MPPSKHITSACLSCRRRKVKCDGMEPCSNCSTSTLPCQYDAESDMRKLSPKKVISGLEARLAQLEKTLRDNNIDQPPANTDAQPASKAISPDTDGPREESTTKSTDERHSPESVRDVGPGHETAPDNNRFPATVIGADQQQLATSLPEDTAWVNHDKTMSLAAMDFGSTAGSLPWSNTFNLPPPTPDQQASRTRSTDNRSQASQRTDDENDVTDILAARMGSLRIAEDGQLRYYGSTSNLHLHRYGYPSLSHASIRRVNTDGMDVLRRLDLDRPIPPSLEMHLAKLYFAWEDPAIHCVDEITFFAEKHKWDDGQQTTPYYSETLNNAICAIGACLADREDAEASLIDPEFYSARAKALLDIEMDSPTIATVQALVIMSATEAAFTRDARGWLYSGMAARLSADLGLHLAVSEQTRQGLLDSRDIYIRQTAYQGVFIHENMWALYVGRPGGMAPAQVSQLEPPQTPLREKTWSPYGNSTGTGRASANTGEKISFDIEACTAANVTLCGFMRQINSTLYSATSTSGSVLLEFLRSTSQRLESWYRALGSSSLRLDEHDQTAVYSPAIFQLHMQYEAVVVSLFRPYLSKSHIQDAMTSTSNLPEDCSAVIHEAGRRCVSSALRISNVLRRYKAQHSLSRINVQAVHLIFTAGLVLIHDVCVRPHAEAKKSLSELQFCCHALGEIGSCYGNATRALETIILVKGEWQRLAVSQRSRKAVGMKRASVNMSESSQINCGSPGTTSKRRNTNTTNTHEGWKMPAFSMPASFDPYGPAFDVSHMGIDGTLPTSSEELMSFDLLSGMTGSESDCNDPNHSAWLDIQPSMPGDNSGFGA